MTCMHRGDLTCDGQLIRKGRQEGPNLPRVSKCSVLEVCLNWWSYPCLWNPLDTFGESSYFRLNSLRPFIIQSPRRVKSRNALEREERAAGNTARQGLETHRKKCSFKWSIAPWARYQVTTQSLNSPLILGRSHLAPGNYYETGSVRFFPSRLQ